MSKGTELRRKLKYARKCFMVFSLLILFIFATFHLNPPNSQFDTAPNLSTLETHAPISIDGNPELAAFPDITGSGTAVAPYIIQNFEITGGAFTAPIEIRNTDKYLIIRNCTLINSSIWEAGIILHNCTNIVVQNCTISQNQDGVYINESSLITLWNNTIEWSEDQGVDGRYSRYLNISANDLLNNDDDHVRLATCDYSTVAGNYAAHDAYSAIDLSYTDHSFILNNNITDNTMGIYTLYSTNNTIADNTMTDSLILSWSDKNRAINNTISNAGTGITVSYADHNVISGNNLSHNNADYNLYISQSENATVLGNTLVNGCIYLDGASLARNRHYFDAANTLDGKPIGFYMDEVGLGPSNFTNAAQIFLINCSFSTITGISLSNLWVGLYLCDSHNNTIRDCNFSANIEGGIRLRWSDDNLLLNNTASYHSGMDEYGIQLFGSDGNNLTGNSVTDNRYGIHVYASFSNTLLSNDATRNTASNFYIENSDFNVLIKNNAIDSSVDHGIYLDDAENNNITQNNASYNNDYGIRLYNSINNRIWLNTFMENYAAQAYYSGTATGNTWDNGSRGNYWGDYRFYHPTASHDGTIWNESYQINTQVDDYPLVSPWGLNWTPQTPTLDPIPPESTNGLVNLTWNADGIVTMFHVYRNTSEITSVAGLPPIASVTTSNITDVVNTNGTFYYVVVAENSLGNSTPSNCENVTVEVYIPYSNHPTNMMYLVNSTPSIEWSLYDETAPGNFAVFLNESPYDIYDWSSTWPNGTSLGIPIDSSTEGVWNYTIYYNDSIGLFGIPDTVIITIIDDPPTSTSPPNLQLLQFSAASILWTLSDDIGAGNFMVSRNGSTYGMYNWTNSWQNGIPINVPINTSEAGVYNYTIYYNDSAGQFGIPDWVIITIVNDPPTSNNPPDANYTLFAGGATIDWVLWDDVAPGNYVVFRNETVYGMYNWSNTWADGVPLGIVVNTSAPGLWNYTIYYNDSVGQLGIPHTVWIDIVPLTPSVEIFAPYNGGIYGEFETVPIITNVTDVYGLTAVQLYINSTYFDNLQYNGSLYLYNWTNTFGYAGINYLQIRAINVYGKINDTEVVWVNITPYTPPAEQADLYNVTVTNSTGQSQANYTQGQQIIYQATIRGDLGGGTYLVMAQTDDPTLQGYLSYNDSVTVTPGEDMIVTFYFDIPAGVGVPSGDYTFYITVWTDYPFNFGICVDYIIGTFTVE